MSVVVTDPWAAMRQRIEEAGQRTDLPAEERLMLLREYEVDLTAMLGLIGKYRGDAWLEQEAREPVMQEAIVALREDARYRAEILEADGSLGEILDDLGVLSNEDLDRLAEEGLLEAWVLEEFAGVVYDELKHPRGRGGKWEDVLGRAIKPKGRRGKGKVALPKPPKPAAPTPPPEPVHAPGSHPSNPIHVGSDVGKAAELLGQGQHVQLEHKRDVSTLLDKLSEIVADAREKGEKAPKYDLCKVAVKNTNLFCKQSKGIPRLKMPQLDGLPTPGSKADALPKDAKGKVNLGDQFREHLRGMGVSVTEGNELASHLKASQNELDGPTVARIANEIETKGRELKPIFISNDDYIVDGHHNWAATIGVDFRDGVGDLSMPVERIDMPIQDVLREAGAFTADWGISGAGIGMGQLEPKVEKEIAQIKQEGLDAWPTKGPDDTALLGDAKDTQELHQVHLRGKTGKVVYTDERTDLHNRIVDTLIRRRMAVPNAKGETEFHPHPGGEFLAPHDAGKRVLLMAGGTASGKSTALAQAPDATPPDAVHIDPDEIKGMLPEYNKLLSMKSRYAASAVHEESSDIAKRVHDEAVKRGLNIVLDGTGDSKAGKFAGKIKDLKAAGYEPELFYVNASTSTAIDRAVSRAKKTGRWVPTPEIRSQHKNVSARFAEDIRPLIEDGTVSKFSLYHTETQTPVLIADGGRGALNVHDQGLYDQFVAKAKEPGG